MTLQALRLLIVLMLCAISTAQTPPAANDPFLSGVATVHGPRAGDLGQALADGVGSGTTIVRYSKNTGGPALSFHDELGRLVILLDVRYEGHFFIVLMLMLHEQAHHYPSSDPPPPVPPEPPADDTPAKRADACQEAAADCETIGALLMYFVFMTGEGAPPPTCRLVQIVGEKYRASMEVCQGDWCLGSACGCSDLANLIALADCP